MRFDRYGRQPFRDTPRKRSAVLRKQRREREALPLFADLVASEQKPVDVIVDERRDRWAVLEQRDRDRRACDCVERVGSWAAIPPTSVRGCCTSGMRTVGLRGAPITSW